MKQHIPFWLVLLFGLLPLGGGLATQGMSDDILEMKVKGVTMDPFGNAPIVVLEDIAGHQAFPIWIGLPEAQAIVRALEGIPSPRPMTHTLLQNILNDLHVKVARIVINDLRSNTFYASIFLLRGSDTVIVDARPSDAIALALGVKAPIFVTKKVLGSIRTVPLSVPSSSRSTTKKFGMHLQSLDDALAEAFHLLTTEGVLVAFVEAGSQAERYGIRRGDVITNVDGRHISNLQELLEIFDTKEVGEDVVLQVVRERQARTIRMSLATHE
jgi:hypothetical protein